MADKHATHDITVTKTVEGVAADASQDFQFKMTLSSDDMDV